MLTNDFVCGTIVLRLKEKTTDKNKKGLKPMKTKLEILALELKEMARKIENLNTQDINAVCDLIGDLTDLRTTIKYNGIGTLEKIEYELTYD